MQWISADVAGGGRRKVGVKVKRRPVVSRVEEAIDGLSWALVVKPEIS